MGNGIMHLTDIEHIQQRTGLYIGCCGDGLNPYDGFYRIFKIAISRAIDEYIQGFGWRIEIKVDQKGVAIMDYGRGIQTDLMKISNNLLFEEKRVVFNYPRYPAAHPIVVVNALSSNFYLESFSDGECRWVKYAKGVLLKSGMEPSSEPDGVFVKYAPDNEHFGDYSFRMDIIDPILRTAAYLNKGLEIVLNGESMKSEKGLLDLVCHNMKEKPLYNPINIKDDKVEVVITHIAGQDGYFPSYVNGMVTDDGGTHLAALKYSLQRILEDYFKLKLSEDCFNGMFGAISLKMNMPTYLNSNYTELGAVRFDERENTPTLKSYIYELVKKHLPKYLDEHQDVAEIIRKRMLGTFKKNVK